MKVKDARTVFETAQNRPAFFWENVLGVKPWQKQLEILESVWRNQITAVRSCHGAGKSWTAARVGLTFLSVLPYSVVISTAPTGRQVQMILWQEWRKAAAASLLPIGGEVLQTMHRIDDGWFAFGFATDVPDNFQGLHATNLLVIVDEAAGVAAPIWEAIDSLRTSSNSRLLVIGNPTDPSCYFASLFKDANVKKIHISAFDTPNFTTFGITEEDIADGTWESKITGPLPYPELVTPGWVKERFDKWQPDSPMYASRVKGNFPETGDNTLIPLAWVEAANARWIDMEEGQPREIGVDIARYGSDESVAAFRAGAKLVQMETWRKNDLMESSGRVRNLIKTSRAAATKVDAIGYGAGVVDRLKELKENVFGIEVSRAPQDPEKFYDLTTELWWALRDRLDPEAHDAIGLPDDEELLAQLSSRRYSFTSRGQIKIESKDDMKKRGLHSPDRADAVVLAFAPTPAKRIISRVL